MSQNNRFDHKLDLRTLLPEDFDAVKQIMEKVYPTMGGSWTLEQYQAMIKRFPDGQLCVEDKGKVVAVALSLVIDSADGVVAVSAGDVVHLRPAAG